MVSSHNSHCYSVIYHKTVLQVICAASSAMCLRCYMRLVLFQNEPAYLYNTELVTSFYELAHDMQALYYGRACAGLLSSTS